MRIQIIDATVETTTGTSKRSGQPYTLHKQKGLMTNDKGERRSCSWTIKEPKDAYPVGTYEVSADTLYLDGYGEFQKGRLVLVRGADDAKKAA